MNTLASEKVLLLSGDPPKDWWMLYSCMAYPEDEIERARAQAAFFHYSLNSPELDQEQKERLLSKSIEVLIHSLALLNDRAPQGLMNETVKNVGKAQWAGEILLKVLSLHFHHGGASVKNAVKLTEHFCQGAKSIGGMDLQASERHLFNCWKHFRSVCHLGAAYSLMNENQNYSEWIDETQHWQDFLAIADALRCLGQEIYAHGQYTPVLEESDMWKVSFLGMNDVAINIPPIPHKTVEALKRIKKISKNTR